MKIYQVICSGGLCGDDFYEYVVNTYINKEKAYKECIELNDKIDNENKQAKICYYCKGGDGCTKKQFNKIKCEKKEIDEEYTNVKTNEYWCKNYEDFSMSYYENEEYTVKEYEVIE